MTMSPATYTVGGSVSGLSSGVSVSLKNGADSVRRATESWGCAAHKRNLGAWQKPIVQRHKSTSCAQ